MQSVADFYGEWKEAAGKDGKNGRDGSRTGRDVKNGKG